MDGEISGKYSGWSRTSHLRVSKKVLRTWQHEAEGCHAAESLFSCLFSYCGHFSLTTWLHRMNCILNRSPVMVSFEQCLHFSVFKAFGLSFRKRSWTSKSPFFKRRNQSWYVVLLRTVFPNFFFYLSSRCVLATVFFE